jgi:hypothetical protein
MARPLSRKRSPKKRSARGFGRARSSGFQPDDRRHDLAGQPDAGLAVEPDVLGFNSSVVF